MGMFSYCTIPCRIYIALEYMIVQQDIYGYLLNKLLQVNAQLCLGLIFSVFHFSF